MILNKKIPKVQVICFSLMLLIIGALWIPQLIFFAFLINVFAVLFLKPSESFYILLFLVPFSYIYKYPGIDQSFVTFTEMAIVVVALFKYKHIKLSSCVFLVLACSYFITRMNTYYMAIPKLLLSYIIVLVFIKSFERNNIAKYLNYFIVGLIFSSVLGIFKETIPSLLAYYDDLNYLWINGVRTIRFSGLFNDPNYFSIALIVALVMLVFLKRYNNYPLFSFYFFFSCLTILGLLTYSKSFVLMLAIVLIFEFALNFKSQRKISSAIEALSIFVLLSIALMGRIEIINTLFYRFTQSEDITTGRSLIWNNYLTSINSGNQTILFGAGLDAPYVNGKAAHNLYIEIIYYSGITGLLIFISSWLFVVFSFHKRRIRLINTLLLVIVLVMYVFLNGFLDNVYFPLYIIFCWILIDLDFKGMKKYENNL